MLKEKLPELLSPAGDLEAFYAAVNGGADAVYLGIDEFSARKRAKNFTFEELDEALDIAHKKNIKVFVTINTLIKDEEIPKVIDLINKLIERRVDGFIIQDIGLLNVLLENKQLLKDNGISLQLSTQASVYGPEGKQFFEDLGLDRVVIARETNINDFKNSRKDKGATRL